MSYVKYYKDVKKYEIRDLARYIALRGLIAKDKLFRIENYLLKNRVQFLYIHHIFKDEEKRLELLIQQLMKYHTFISHNEAIQKIISGTIDRPYISISSDDGFKNNLNFAEILNRFGIKACFFINPGIIGNTNYQSVKEYCKNRLNFSPVEFLNWDDIESLLRSGHEIGSHTMNHINMARTDLEVLRSECTQSYEVITKKCGQVKHFAFPYGRFSHFSPVAKEIVFSSGYETCSSAERGCHISNDSEIFLNKELCIRRDLVILDWNIDEVFYFLSSNSRKVTINNNYFPY